MINSISSGQLLLVLVGLTTILVVKLPPAPLIAGITRDTLTKAHMLKAYEDMDRQIGHSSPSAPRASMMRFTHSSWITVKGVSPLLMAATKESTSATKFTVNWNCSTTGFAHSFAQILYHSHHPLPAVYGLKYRIASIQQSGQNASLAMWSAS